MMIFMAFLFPAMIAVGLLAIDAVRAYSQAAMINYATQAAALAAGTQLGNYYTQGSTTGTATIKSAATTISQANTANLPNVATTTTVTLGNWDSVASAFTPLGAGTSPNAVQVIGQGTIATLLGGTVGQPSLTVTKTAVATLGTGKVANVIVLNDMGMPGNAVQNLGVANSAQAYWWKQQMVADQAILDCLTATGNSVSQFGVTGFVEQPYILQALTTVNSGTNATTMKNTLVRSGNIATGSIPGAPSAADYQYCRESKTRMVYCHGSNVAAGIYSAIQQFSQAAYTGTSNHIVIITNELPVYDPVAPAVTYTPTMGTGVSVSGGQGTGRSATALCGTSPVCNATYLLEMAEGQAAGAGTGVAVNGVTVAFTVSSIYFSGDASTPSGSATAYATEIASWAKNGGLALQTSSLTDSVSGGVTTPGVATQARKVCQMIGASLQLASN